MPLRSVSRSFQCLHSHSMAAAATAEVVSTAVVEVSVVEASTAAGASMEVAVPSAEGDTKAVFAAVPVTAGVLMAATARRGAWRGAVKDSQAAVQVLIPLAIRTFVPRSMMAAGIPSATAQAPREALRVSVKDVPQALPVQLNMHVTPELPTAPGIHLAGRDLADRGAQVLEARE
ncbi:MAG: hypothetical protein WBW53_11640 [Terriglobales bacterium]